jgi:hypothetical protein
MRFRPSPLTVQQNNHTVTLDLRPTKTLLVWNENEHQELDDADLQECWKQGSTHVCNVPAAFHTQPHRSCLGSLYVEDLTHVAEHCHVQQTNRSWAATGLNGDQVAVYFRDPTRVQIACPGRARRSVLLQGTQVVRIAANCSMTGDDLRIASRADALLRVPVITAPTWDTAVLLEGKTAEQIQTIRQHLHRSSIRPDPEIGAMLQQDQRECDEAREDQDADQRHHVFFVTLCVLTGIIPLFCLFRYACLFFRAQKPNLR